MTPRPASAAYAKTPLMFQKKSGLAGSPTEVPKSESAYSSSSSYLLLVAMPFVTSSDALVTSSFLFLVVMPGATSSEHCSVRSAKKCQVESK